MATPKITMPSDKIEAFCRKWQITEFALFGSVLRDDFGPDSDVDVLVSFAADARWSLWDHVEMEEELRALLGRPVELLTRRAVEQSPNWVRRNSILSSAETVYGRR